LFSNSFFSCFHLSGLTMATFELNNVRICNLWVGFGQHQSRRRLIFLIWGRSGHKNKILKRLKNPVFSITTKLWK
jgi:hypothetical protein